MLDPYIHPFHQWVRVQCSHVQSTRTRLLKIRVWGLTGAWYLSILTDINIYSIRQRSPKYSLAFLPLRLFVIPVLSTNVRPAMLPCCNAHVSMCMQRCAVEAQCCTERGPPPCQYSYLVAAAKVPVQHSTGPLLASQTGPADATERLVCQCTPLGIPQAGA